MTRTIEIAPPEELKDLSDVGWFQLPDLGSMLVLRQRNRRTPVNLNPAVQILRIVPKSLK